MEDTAIILDECAALTRAGADSRKSAGDSIASALKPCRKPLPPGAWQLHHPLILPQET